MRTTLLALGYFALFSGTFIGMLFWLKSRRKTRRPFGDEFRLLRAPGESQLELSRKLEDDLLFKFAWTSLIPITVGCAILAVAIKLPSSLVLYGAILAAIAFIASIYYSARKLAEAVREIADRYLGYFGERVVAECLEPLKQQGWRVFHDVPAQNNGNAFNIDHIAVGPQGVFVIETKTRRKGHGRDDHKVIYDGKTLHWPWGDDAHGLEQAERNAQWLAKLLQEQLGDRFHISPILTIPGWWVELKPSRESRITRVTNPKGLAKFLPAGPETLSSQKMVAVSSLLEQRCRTIEF